MDSNQVATHLITQYGQYLETYRHHLELFSKLLALYFALVGTVTGVIFSDKTSEDSRKSLKVFMIAISALMLAGAYFAFKFGLRLAQAIAELETVLQMPTRFPFDGPKYMLALSAVASFMVLLTFAFLLRKKPGVSRK